MATRCPTHFLSGLGQAGRCQRGEEEDRMAEFHAPGDILIAIATEEHAQAELGVAVFADALPAPGHRASSDAAISTVDSPTL